MNKEDSIPSAEDITGPCICDSAYKDRGLAQPDCAFCDHGEEVALLIERIYALKEVVKEASEELEWAYKELAPIWRNQGLEWLATKYEKPFEKIQEVAYDLKQVLKKTVYPR